MSHAEQEERINGQADQPSQKPTPPSNPDVLFQQLIETLSAYIANKDHLAQIESAYLYAKTHHGDQLRKSGEPYITHPVAVAIILAGLKVDPASIIAAILHDVVEDTSVDILDIEKSFGRPIAGLVDGLTKIRKIKFRSSQEKMAENFRKMILAMAKDLRVIIIKLADRLHNMRTLASLAQDKRRRIAQETLDIYAPLAGRLGIYGIRSELEDLCLKEIKNGVYKEISKKIASKKEERSASILEVKIQIEKELSKFGFKNCIVYGRPKHFFSIYKKMVDRQIAFEDIHDLFAFRILVDSIKDCYEALGIIHAMWKPMPGRFKDYIAMPKANLYQSLHTTVIRSNGVPAEIQIRTHDMQHICEFGVAAHWAYKEASEPLQNTENTDLKKFAWLRQMMEMQHELKDPSEFLDAVKVDLFEEEIFVFTPKGDVIQLPMGATPLDFAFAVHTNVGLTTIGAKVNGRITPLRGKVKSGDIVEIITSSHQKPSKDWLSFVTTARARNKIRSFLRSEQRQSSRKVGYEILVAALSKRGISLEKNLGEAKKELIIKTARESNIEDVYIALGYGKLDVRQLLTQVFKEEKEQHTKSHEEGLDELSVAVKVRKGSSSGVLVSGLSHILVTFGKCCNPLPGEPIIGFVTKGRGVSVHKDACTKALDLDPARKILVSWSAESSETHQKVPTYTVFLQVITHDRPGLLSEITGAISACQVNIVKAQVKVSEDLMGVLDFEMSLRNLKQLHQVMGKIEAVSDVISVERR